jgi:hypothetical protein
MGEARLKTLNFNRKILSSIFTKTDWATMPQLVYVSSRTHFGYDFNITSLLYHIRDKDLIFRGGNGIGKFHNKIPKS